MTLVDLNKNNNKQRKKESLKAKGEQKIGRIFLL